MQVQGALFWETFGATEALEAFDPQMLYPLRTNTTHNKLKKTNRLSAYTFLLEKGVVKLARNGLEIDLRAATCAKKLHGGLLLIIRQVGSCTNSAISSIQFGNSSFKQGF